MSAEEEKYTKFLNENGLLPRLHEILAQLVQMEPLPIDPLMEILHAVGCPLIPQAQMKALERKVSRAQDELRYLRRLLIDLGGQDDLYDSDSDEDEYVGHVGEMGAASLRTEEPIAQYVVDASIAIREDPISDYEDEQPCCSHSIHGNVKQR
ncbi:uncharacterized protein LOC117790337 [Drosophila innubila]|uniref:uncharacterized protein LOC117790337 n=1 Tax=Drosophila innubila TaxID=198719 RepID=UPI00148BFBAA|nr:uncharacterized protein LOC117790337 [Drosophila innubila]